MIAGAATARARAASGRFDSARRRHDPQPPVLQLLRRGLCRHRAGALLLAALPLSEVRREPPRTAACRRTAVVSTAAAPPPAAAARLRAVWPEVYARQYP